MYMIYQEIDFVWTIQWSFLESVSPVQNDHFDCRNVADLSVALMAKARISYLEPIWFSRV